MTGTHGPIADRVTDRDHVHDQRDVRTYERPTEPPLGQTSEPRALPVRMLATT